MVNISRKSTTALHRSLLLTIS